jgi:uncharacterized protein
MIDLEPEEIRVLGCLMEKQVTTPDVYPLTVNALIAACNQTTNRHPVVRYGEAEVTAALQSLREHHLTRIVYSPSNRAPKHRHVADEVLDLDPAQQAVLCVLLLRGAQTVGEIKGRTERLHGFDDLRAVEEVLDRLAARDDALVLRLPRLPGQKDSRWVHLLGGPVDVDALQATAEVAAPAAGFSRTERVGELESRVVALEGEIAQLKADVAHLLSLFD